jgi:hypothetical protein
LYFFIASQARNLCTIVRPFLQNWEGSALPMDIARPIINVFHSKLAIAVDWFVHADSAQSSGRYDGAEEGHQQQQQLTPLSIPQSTGMHLSSLAVTFHKLAVTRRSDKSAAVVIGVPVYTQALTHYFFLSPSGVMHDRMLCRHDPSYAHYLNAQRERAAAAHHAALRQQQQQLRDEELRREMASRESERVPQSESEQHLLAYKNDTRAGLTVEDVLRYCALL